MPKASELKRGMVIDIDGVPHIVKLFDAKNPSSRGAATLYKVRYKNLKTGLKLEESYKGDDLLKLADCQRCPVQFSYMDGDDYVFMNLDDYSQYPLSADDVGDAKAYLTEGLEDIIALIMDGILLGIELPNAVNLLVVETAPGIKGASASARTKPAIVSTGAEFQVPEYLENGETIKINTTTGKFLSRA